MNTKTIVLAAVIAVAVVAGAAYWMNNQSATDQTAQAETAIDNTVAPAFGEVVDQAQEAMDTAADAASEAMDSVENAADEMAHEMDEAADSVQ